MRSEHVSENRGRKQSVTKEEIFDYLSDKRWHTKLEIAASYEVCPSTVSKRIKELVIDGWGIITGSLGYMLTEPADITDEDMARAIERMVNYMVGIVARQALNAKPMKRLMAAARKMLPKTKDERMIVRKYLVQLTHLIDWQESEDEDIE